MTNLDRDCATLYLSWEVGLEKKGAAMAKTNQQRPPRFEIGRSMRIAGLGGRFGDHNRAQIPQLWRRFGPEYFGRVPGQVDRKCYGVCSNMDDNSNVDYLAGVEVSAFAELPAKLTQLTITPQRYVVFPHDGHISEISRTWMDIFGVWLLQSGCEAAVAQSFECYGEAIDPEVAIGNVEIWIPIKA
jgi:AraC family transcriptional regulator